MRAAQPIEPWEGDGPRDAPRVYQGVPKSTPPPDRVASVYPAEAELRWINGDS